MNGDKVSAKMVMDKLKAEGWTYRAKGDPKVPLFWICNPEPADAIRYQKITGLLAGGKDHIGPGKERIVNLERIIPSLADSDKNIAQQLTNDLRKALENY